MTLSQHPRLYQFEIIGADSARARLAATRSSSRRPTWVGTQIAGSDGTLMHTLVSLLAYPSDGWGLLSTYAALLDLDYYKGEDYYHDYYINSSLNHLTKDFTLPHWVNGLRSMMVDASAPVILVL